MRNKWVQWKWLLAITLSQMLGCMFCFSPPSPACSTWLSLRATQFVTFSVKQFSFCSPGICCSTIDSVALSRIGTKLGIRLCFRNRPLLSTDVVAVAQQFWPVIARNIMYSLLGRSKQWTVINFAQSYRRQEFLISFQFTEVAEK